VLAKKENTESETPVEEDNFVVTSAGNAGFAADRNTLNAPADGKLVLTIGAVDAFGARADFSSVGRAADGRIKPDVMAQGVLVKGINAATRNQYALSNGTSFSCPLAAGVVALILQAHPDWNVMRVRRALRSTASNADSPTRLVGWGILDGVAALDRYCTYRLLRRDRNSI